MCEQRCLIIEFYGIYLYELSFNLDDLTYWDMDKMADILRMTTSFSSIGIVLFWIPIPKE